LPFLAAQDVDLLATPAPALHPAEGRPLWPLVVAGWLAGFLGQWASVILWVPPSQQSTIWMPGSLLLGIVLLTESRGWPFVVLAAGAGQSTLFQILGIATPLQSIILAVELAFVVSLSAWALLWLLKHPIGFTTFREFLVYLAVVVTGGSLVASAVFIGGAAAFEYRPATLLIWRTFTLSAVLGFLMVTPTVVLLARNLDAIRSDTAGRRIEGLTLTLLMVVASGIVFGGPGGRHLFWPLFTIVIPPLLLWGALRFGALGASGSVLLVTLISTFGASQGLGPFHLESAAENTLSLQVFMLGTGLPLVGLAVILGEQRRTLAVLRQTHLRLQDLNRDLLEARESEASRIARELHDDIGQRMALVSIGLSHLRRVFHPASDGVGEVSRLQEQASSISRSLRELSHQLHPTALQHTGLTVALQIAAEEAARVTGLDIQVVADGDTSNLPPEVALCLFRIAQEGLGNAVRHAGARSIRLSLRRDDAGVMLLVADDGRGFSPSKARSGSGLGLHSMMQRLSLVDGALTIDTAPDAGTRIRAQVPLHGGSLA
jgi:two-component system sensor histidine kinase UhpB